MIHEWKKELPQAESTFKKAMEYDPDYAATMSNLGALYGRSGRLDEAIEILQRAVAKDPDNLESWVNLGAAQGRKGHSREAIEALETARGKGVRTTTLYNALALAYLQNRQPDKAKEFLRESLALDPGQKDAQDLLKAVSRPS
jgi:tetratricopeptide (TPR) repeat protein